MHPKMLMAMAETFSALAQDPLSTPYTRHGEAPPEKGTSRKKIKAKRRKAVIKKANRK